MGREKEGTLQEEFIGPNIKLTRDDLEEILEVFLHNLDEVVIEDGDKAYDSLDDLETYRGKYIGHLVITGKGPFTFFEVNNPVNQREFASLQKIRPLVSGLSSNH